MSDIVGAAVLESIRLTLVHIQLEPVSHQKF